MKKLLIIAAVIALFVVVKMIYQPNNLVCPMDFKDKNEYVESAGNWLSNYYKKNPQASEEEVLQARMDYLLKAGCVDLAQKRR